MRSTLHTYQPEVVNIILKPYTPTQQIAWSLQPGLCINVWLEAAQMAHKASADLDAAM